MISSIKKVFSNFYFLLCCCFIFIFCWVKNNAFFIVKDKKKSIISFNNHPSSLIKNTAKTNNNGFENNIIKSSTKFEQVAGMETEKELLKRFIDILKDSQKYKDAGASIPKGILLYGPPGTGKTFLAQAFAGEAGIPFYSFVGTDFLQKIHGDSAKNIKNLFNEAGNMSKNPKGSIIFIDEIDSFGALKNDFDQKSKEILTTFLTELDGIKAKQNILDEKTPIIIIAATNRFESLDQALIRPGRFDYLVKVDLPDLNAREKILNSFATKTQIFHGVDLKPLAQVTEGISSAQLKSIINEAIILNLNNNPNKNQIDMKTIIEAKDNILLGFSKKDHKYDTKAKEIIATNQAAKSIVSQIKKTYFLGSISLLPRLNDKFLFLSPQSNSSYLTFQDELFQRIIVLLSGKAAEEVILQNTVDKTCSDFEEALKQAEKLTDFFAYKVISSKDQEEFQKDILQRCYSDAKSLVKLNQDLIKKLAKELQTHEFFTIDAIKDFLSENIFQENISIEENNKQNLLFLFTLSFIFVFLVLSLLIVIFRFIFLFLDIKIFSLFTKKYLLFTTLNILSLVIASIIIIIFPKSSLPFSSLFHWKGQSIAINKLFSKIDQYEIKKMTCIAKKSWLEGVYNLVNIVDKNGDTFYCKLKPLSQNTFDQKISNLKVKDFEVIEEPYFDYFNFFFKLILFLSSLVFLFYRYINIKWIRQQLKNSKTNSFPYFSEINE